MTTDPDQLANEFWQIMEQMSEEDRQKLRQAPIETSQPKSKSLGWARYDDPIYTNAGWNFLMGKNLNQRLKPKNEDENRKES
jgi:hypothetical protein